jgi:hypothetical protein
MFENVSLTDQVQRYPLPSVGVALATGFVLGRLLGGSSPDAQSYTSNDTYASLRSSTTPTQPAPNDPTWEATTGSKFAASSNDSAWQPPANASDGPGIMSTLQSGLSDSILKGTGQAPTDLVSSITAALTGILVDKAKELLDQNLPGFAERYEQAARSAGARQPAGAFGAAAPSNPITSGYQAHAPAAGSLHS